MMRKKVLVLWAVLTLLAASTAILCLHPQIGWRTHILAGKLAGRFPDVGWGDTVAAIIPARLSADLDLSALSVSEARRDSEPCSVLWHSCIGDFWGRSGDKDALRVAVRFRLFDSIYLRGAAAIQPGDVVIDGGSHLGTFTRFALDRGAGLVIAVEPDAITMTCFRKTFRHEIEQGRVVPVEEALWGAPGRTRFQPNASSIASAVVAPETGRTSETGFVEVGTTSVDHIVEKLQLRRVDFVKLNVEGSERQAIQGAMKTLGRFKPRLLVSLEHHADDYTVIPQMVGRIVSEYRIRTRGRLQACFYLN